MQSSAQSSVKPLAQATAGLPFSDIVVLELCTVVSGPFAGSLMADLGAEVIKIEMPGKGDIQRNAGFKKEGVSVWWGVASRNKKCITLDFKQPEGRVLLEGLIKKADVLIENYRPGALHEAGFGWDAVHAMNPKLAMLSISGYGGTGPAASKPGFGKISEGYSGMVALTGDPEDRPLYVGFSLGDTATGLFGIMGVAMGLLQRDIGGGEGVHVDIGLYEPLFRMLECQMATLERTGEAPVRQGTSDPYGWGVKQESRPLLRCLKASSGDWFFVSIPNKEVLDRLGAGGKGESPDDSLATWAAGLDPEALRTALMGAGASIVPVLDGASLAKNEYLCARGDVLDVEHSRLGTISVPGYVLPPGVEGDRRVPFHDSELGEYTQQVFARYLDMTPAEFERLRSSGVI